MREDKTPTGQWRPATQGAIRLLFPVLRHTNQYPQYDAMPSGHVATLMRAITAITTSYPEIRWIKPVDHSLIGIMAIEMISSKIYWISDYPLAILIGYAIGKNAARRRIVKKIMPRP
ncbi:phosphatase PAP2 family protein [Arenibacter sp. F26102]|uniref:phosphatase PAP2 family protein n=1 Tax=Arenibacter sp. F26102 TaxID=2926416 RepID=UPI001FF504E9|nr:phosphatase PAP2 family protein [Arenibacter sp. F26102]MCK0145916.1 phosphatase PAP2 family protein [Arenibacter sp. F26102]